MIVAHRGGIGPENTLQTIMRSIRDNIKYIEIDINITKDGIPVLCHDKTIDRTANGRGRVDQYTLELLEHFDAGYYLEEYRGTGYTIPTLQSVMEVIPFDVTLYLDIKSKHVIQSVIDLINGYNMIDRVILDAFESKISKRLRKLNRYRVPTVTNCLGMIRSYIRSYPDNDIVIMYSSKMTDLLITKKYIKSIHKSGRRAAVWGKISSREKIDRFISIGIDYILLDDYTISQ